MSKIITLIICFYSQIVIAQSVAIPLLPQIEKRPAFRALPYPQDYDQMDLAKDYAAIYLRFSTEKYLYTKAYQLKFQYELATSRFLENLSLQKPPRFHNTTDFLNNLYQFSTLMKTSYGTCMGVTSMIRKINMLAHYDPDNTSNQNIPDPENNPIAWKHFFEKKIDLISKNQPVIIPLFKDTRSFTSKKNSFHQYFLRHSLDQWALNNVTLQGGVFQMYPSVAKKMSTSDRLTLYKKLKRRLEYGYNPKIFFALKGSLLDTDNIRIHVVQVFKLSEINEQGEYHIHYWDPNYAFPDPKRYPEKTEEEIAYLSNVAGIMTVPQSGAIASHNYEDISVVDIYRWDDAEISQITDHYRSFCKLNKEYCFFN